MARSNKSTALTVLMWTTLLFMCPNVVWPPAHGQFQLEQAFPNLSFINPVDLQNSGDGTDRIFVLEQRGVISVFANNSGVLTKTTFLDIQARVDDTGNEEGLLGLAFHPDYENNGFFYVNYTAAGPDRTVVSRFEVTSDPDVADPNSELLILRFLQPFSNHNGGQITFGPDDGYLYIASGDGGGGSDPFCNAQNLESLLGKILRIDVDSPSGPMNYGIPPDNPFEGNTEGYREEIFSYGMRNPWRFSIDPVTGWIWCGDVGQSDWEEVDIIQNGGNYGWAIMEGNHCYNSPYACAPDTCDQTGLIPAIWEYDHGVGFAITGGHVYRGPGVPGLTGKYIYTDFLTRPIWSLEYDGINPPVNTFLLSSPAGISSFGLDEASELYMCAFDGRIYRFTPTALPITMSISIDPQWIPIPAAGDTVPTDLTITNTSLTDTIIVPMEIRLTDPNDITRVLLSKMPLVGPDRTLNKNPLIRIPGSGPPGQYSLRVHWGESLEFASDPFLFDKSPVLDKGGIQTASAAEHLTLEPVFPNPFNPSTTIRYNLPEDSWVTLKVYNMLGQEVAVLVETFQDAGPHTVVWDAKDKSSASVSSGVYICALSTDRISLTQEIVLMK